MSEFCVWCTTTTSTTSTTTTTTVIEYINKAQLKESLIKSAKLVMQVPLDEPAPLFAIDSVIKSLQKTKVLLQKQTSDPSSGKGIQQMVEAYDEAIKELIPLKKNPKIPPPK